MTVSSRYEERQDGQGEHRRPGDLQPPILVTDEQGLQELLAAASQAPVVAVDTESNSLFAYYHRICLIQFSLPSGDWVVDPLAVDAHPLGVLFASSGCQKIFHAAENDILGLKRDFDFSFANIFDTMRAARILQWPSVGLAAILASRFGVKLNKRLQRTDWGQRPLKAEQLAYAQLDTHYLLPLRAQQMQALRTCNRWREAEENFQRLVSLEWTEKPFDINAFWKIRGVYDLSPQGRAVLRELFLFREQRARRLDRPPFKVLNNEVLVALSRHQPSSPKALRQAPGLTPGQVRRHGKGILAAIARGQAAKPPRPPRRRRYS